MSIINSAIFHRALAEDVLEVGSGGFEAEIVENALEIGSWYVAFSILVESQKSLKGKQEE